MAPAASGGGYGLTDREAIGAMKGLKLVTGTFANEALDAGISALQEREKRIEGCSLWHSNFVYNYCPNCGAKMDLED